jgi:glycosyltransferase involved in cell wall biosynthesis
MEAGLTLEGGRRIRGEGRKAAGRPLVSVITVVFNGAATLEHAIQSVATQTYENIEHIVIDGGSKDGTLDIIRKFDAQLEYWASERDNGIYDAMNKGLACARGEYVGMLNADDYFAEPGAVEMIVARLQATNADAVFSCLDIVDAENPGRILRKYRVANFTPFMLRIGVMPPHPTFYCKRSCYEKLGPAPYRTDYRIASDFELLVRLLLKQRIRWSFIDAVTVKMRAGGLSSQGIKSSWIINREIIRACTENGLYTNMFLLLLKLPIRLMERMA